ncbi:MAG: serine/threonine protein kinase [Verrucomicrobiaceae bacterium]|nr:serine/threonine protein kinase [Verrucomicrobiaceae bacterium]
MPANSQLTAHSSQLTAHSSQLTAHSSQLTAHSSQLTAHSSQSAAQSQAWAAPLPAELQPYLPTYQLDCLLGQGGMGAVYAARQTALDRPVAIKVLPLMAGGEDGSYAERFVTEARAMARLTHPGIVAVHDFGQTANGLLYFVMEFVDGTDVHRLVSEQGALSSEQSLAIAANVCEALAYAHEAGVVHRDIKPANILIGHNGQVKVADFGLARVDSPAVGLTQMNLVMGTPDYVAPEALVLGVMVDARADLYAVGVMLYYMLTADVPRGIFEPASQRVPGLDPRFDAVITRAMQRDREKRYQSAAEMQQALTAIHDTPYAATLPAPVAAAPAPSGPMRPAPRPPGTHAVNRVAAPPPAPERGLAAKLIPTLAAFALVAAGGWYIFGRSPTAVPPPASLSATTTSTSPSIAATPPVAPTPQPSHRLTQADFVGEWTIDLESSKDDRRILTAGGEAQLWKKGHFLTKDDGKPLFAGRYWQYNAKDGTAEMFLDDGKLIEIWRAKSATEIDIEDRYYDPPRHYNAVHATDSWAENAKKITAPPVDSPFIGEWTASSGFGSGQFRRVLLPDGHFESWKDSKSEGSWWRGNHWHSVDDGVEIRSPDGLYWVSFKSDGPDRLLLTDSTHKKSEPTALTRATDPWHPKSPRPAPPPKPVVAESMPAPAAPAVPKLPAELEELKTTFDAELDKTVTGPARASMAVLNQGYLAGLQRAATATPALAAHIQPETQLLAAGQPLPADTEATPEALVKLHIIYRAETSKISEKRTSAHLALLTPYITRLIQLEAQLTRASRIDDATAVKTYREGLSAALTAQH